MGQALAKLYLLAQARRFSGFVYVNGEAHFVVELTARLHAAAVAAAALVPDMAAASHAPAHRNNSVARSAREPSGHAT